MRAGELAGDCEAKRLRAHQAVIEALDCDAHGSCSSNSRCGSKTEDGKSSPPASRKIQYQGTPAPAWENAMKNW